MKRASVVLGALLLAGLFSGCGDDGGTGGGGTGGTGVGGGVGGDGGAAGSGGGSPEVAACQDVAGQIKAVCGDPVRECMFGQYSGYCETLNTVALTEALDCLLAQSSAAGGCRTFSDPSGAAACVEAALSKLDTTAAEAAAQYVVAKCPQVMVDTLLYASEPPLALATGAQLAALDTCMADATDCDTANECYKAAFPEIWDICN